MRAAPEILAALSALVDAIDFEGQNGAIRFNPGSPYELEVLREARVALAKAEAEAEAARDDAMMGVL